MSGAFVRGTIQAALPWSESGKLVMGDNTGGLLSRLIFQPGFRKLPPQNAHFPGSGDSDGGYLGFPAAGMVGGKYVQNLDFNIIPDPKALLNLSAKNKHVYSSLFLSCCP